MQISNQNVQRPTLFQELFDKLITYSNEVIEYINTPTINKSLLNIALLLILCLIISKQRLNT